MVPLTAFISLVLSWLILGAVGSPTAQISQHRRATKPCTQIWVRKEWRDLSVADRQAYITAVKCLQSTPPHLSLEGVYSRFDEFQKTHVDLTDNVHQVGHFLAWHRHFLTLYAKALREECGYNGPATYWDWTRDADSTKQLKESPVFDPVTGFGGDGVPGTYTPPRDPTMPFPVPVGRQGCVATGPFNTSKVALGPGRYVGQHCLVRGIDESMKRTLTSASVQTVMSRTTFETFRVSLEGTGPSTSIHNSGHGGVGGEMVNPYSSPGDPLFYLHHGNLDRIWWHWQRADRTNRLYAISGPTTQRPPFTNITLDYLMPFMSLGPSVTVRDVMDSELDPECFTYAD